MNIEITTSETLDSNMEIVRYPGQAAKNLTIIASMHKNKKRQIKKPPCGISCWTRRLMVQWKKEGNMLGREYEKRIHGSR